MPDDSPVITVQKSTVVRVGIAILVVAALGAGVGIGLAVGSSPTGHSPNALSVPQHAHAPVATTTTTILATTTTDAAPLPEVESCSNSPGAVELRPGFIGFGCAAVNTAVTAIAWSSWTPSTASGTGTFNQNNCVPDCASGAHTTSQVAVSLTNPGQYLGRLVFQNVTVTPLRGGASVENTGEPGAAWGTE